MIVHFWRIYLNSFSVFFQWFEFCFQASSLIAKRIHFWSCFSLSGLFLEPFLANLFGLFFGHVGSSFVLGRTLGALGANFFITKTVWTTKGAPVGFPPKFSQFDGAIFEPVFVIFSFFWALFLSIVFCWVLRPIFHGFWLHFDTIFLYCFGFVGTSGFSDFWQPFHSKTRFLQVRGCQI